MPPPLAAILTVGLIFFLYRRDRQSKPNVTSAIWIPLIWVFCSTSRGVSDWIYTLTGVYAGGLSLEEGSPVDRTFFIIMIAAGINILRKRHVRLGGIMRDNQWLAAFLIYCFIAILWSEF